MRGYVGYEQGYDAISERLSCASIPAQQQHNVSQGIYVALAVLGSVSWYPQKTVWNGRLKNHEFKAWAREMEGCTAS